MSKELADRFERDLSASEETAERARQARKRGAALDVDWEKAFEAYAVQANQDPKRFIRFPDTEPEFLDPILFSRPFSEEQSDDEERYESATP